jgi:hypothetical protein
MTVAALLTAALGTGGLFVLFALLHSSRGCSRDCGSCSATCSAREGRPR